MEGSPKRQKRDKTSVRGVDFPFLIYRTNRRKVRSKMSRAFRKLELAGYDFPNVFPRYYVGFLSKSELVDEEMNLSDDTYFVYSSYNLTGFSACAKTDILFEIERDTIEEAVAHMEEHFSSVKPIDRGDALIFKKKLNRRVKEAVNTWSIVGKRLGVVKDIRVVIGKMIWAHKREWVP